jgi:glycosyltransferase involved in cell wall biosynthesis
MKVLYSCLSKSWGGMEMYTLSAIKQLQKRQIHVELLCISESRIHIEANNIGMIIHPVKASGYFHPYTILKLVSIIYRGEYDLIHAQASKDLWLLVPAVKLLRSKIPLILTKHVGSGIIKKDKFHKWIYERLTLALAISRVIKKNLMETCPLEESKIKLMYDGIDLEKFDPDKVTGRKVREEFVIGENDIVIGMLARLSPGKGHEEFLAAAEKLNLKYNNLKYLIVGEASRGENHYADSIKLLAEDYNISNVIFTGYRSDTPQVIAAMDIFVFPSHGEAFGIALTEAMAMVKPSVCSNSDGVLDIAVDNETSFLFENKNVEDLVRKIELLINSFATRNQLGKASRKRVVENFNFDILTEKLIMTYDELLNK